MPSIEQHSVATVPLRMLFNDTDLSVGTGFIWEHAGKHFLITNWHNVSGRDVFTKKHLSKTAGEPNRLALWLNVAGKLGVKAEAFLPIRDGYGAPLWLVHPKMGNDADVVAMPLPPIPEADMYPINRMQNDPMTVRVGADVFVLGYPYGLGPGGLPIWKRGSIASEPMLVSPEQPYILVDTASRPGMSGSPVIARTNGSYTDANGNMMMTGGLPTRFVGIYSGRMVAPDPLDAQLGLVWPEALIREIVAGGVNDA